MPPKPESSSNKASGDILAMLRDMQIRSDHQYATLSAEISTLRDRMNTNPPLPPPPPPPLFQHTPKTPKISLLPFDGSNPLDWIFQAEQYFELT